MGNNRRCKQRPIISVILYKEIFMSDVIVNRVAESGLVEIDLAKYHPGENIVVFDLKDFLFMGLIIKEKEFRAALKEHDFKKYTGQLVTVTCSAEAIIPMWAYMLVSTSLQPFAKDITTGNANTAHQYFFVKNIQQHIHPEAYKDKRVVVKGCGDITINDFAYFEITKLLVPVAKSIMYGEPCSTVPVYKKTTA